MDHAQKALTHAPDPELYSRALALEYLATAKTRVDSAPYNEIIDHTRASLNEIKKWRLTIDDQESQQRANIFEINGRLNLALYQHYADRFDEAIESLESLTNDTRLKLHTSSAFTAKLLLSNVLNDARLFNKARDVLFSHDLMELIYTQHEEFRLRSARSLYFANTGRLQEAIVEIEKALHYFYNNDEKEIDGNILVRASRFYAEVGAYQEARNLLPDLRTRTGKHSGMDYELNRAMVAALLQIETESEEEGKSAIDYVETLFTDERAIDLKVSHHQLDERKIRFLLRHKGNESAFQYAASLPTVANATLQSHEPDRQLCLLYYCELALDQGQSVTEQIETCWFASFICSQWARWRASLCLARDLDRRGELAAAILFAKLACQQVLSLSVPLLRYADQRRWLPTELMKPFKLTEVLLRKNGSIAEAEWSYYQRNSLEDRLRFAKFPDMVIVGPLVEITTNVALSEPEKTILDDTEHKALQLVNHYEDGRSLAQSVAESGLINRLTSINSLTLRNTSKPPPVVAHSPAPGVCPRGQLQLRYWFDHNTLWVTASSAAKQIQQALSIDLDSVRETVFKFRISEHGSDTSTALSRYLYDTLAQPILKQFDRIDTLIIRPVDALRLLPFGALLHVKTPLLDRFRLAVSHGNQVSSSAFSSKTALLLATSDHGPDTPVLQYDADASALSSHELQTLADDDWCLSSLQSALQSQPDVVHICCHHDYRPSSPNQSVFKLSRQREVNVHELLELEGWSDVDLVHLATCNAALTSGDYPSLADLFIQSGVRCVIASLHPLHNESAGEFSHNLYNELRQSRDILDAVRQSRQKMLVQNNHVWRAYELWLGAA